MRAMSKQDNRLQSAVARFAKDRRGNFGILFSVASLGIVMAGGMALDASRLYTAYSKLGNAADAAVLATTRDLTTGVIAEADAKGAVEKFFLANFDGAVSPVVDGVILDKAAKTVELKAHVTLPMTLTQIAGIKDQVVAISSKAVYSDTKVEISMSLDITGSMNQAIPGTGDKKIDALKEAAKQAVDTLIPTSAAASRIRIGLVPYAAAVDADPVISKISTTGSSSCVIERTDDEKFSDAFAGPSNPVGSKKGWCPQSEIQPLTGNATLLKTKIQNFKTGGVTAGHVGIAWAQYMLSSKWNAAWPMGSDAAPATDVGTRKFAIIMTDGEFNTFLSKGQANTADGKKKSREYALGLCDQMKKGKITVFTIAFAAGSEAETLMQDCATPDTGLAKFSFKASDKAELKSAFQEISANIQKLVLVN